MSNEGGESAQSLGKAEHMMVRWMCGVSLKDRKRSEVLYSLNGECSEVVMRGRLNWTLGMWNLIEWMMIRYRHFMVAAARPAGQGQEDLDRHLIKSDEY